MSSRRERSAGGEESQRVGLARWIKHVETSRFRGELIAALLMIAMAAVALVDYFTGPLVSLAVFYLLPVAAGTILLGRRAGAAVAVLSGLSSFVCDVLLIGRYRHPAIAAWNALLMFATLLFVVEVLTRLRERTRNAVAAEQRSRDFLAFAAHQLRAPLAGIRSGVDALIVGGAGDPDAGELLSGLAYDSGRAARLLTSLLRIARLDEREPLPTRSIDLADLARQQTQWAAGYLRTDLSWEFDLVRGARTDSVCNPDAVREALSNVLDNASRHAVSRVTVSVQGGNPSIRIVVVDDGPGPPETATTSIFDRFVSLDGRGGSGLGLPIARGICEAHGGTLRYDNGAFTLSIPTRRTDVEAPPAASNGRSKRRPESAIGAA